MKMAINGSMLSSLLRDLCKRGRTYETVKAFRSNVLKSEKHVVNVKICHVLLAV